MSNIKILTEGLTEILFVNEVLKPYLDERGVLVRPFLLQEGGGIIKYPRAKKQILNTINSDPSCFCTLLVDFYGLRKDWPGREDADSQANRHMTYLKKAETVEKALFGDICEQLGSSFNPSRFIPYIQMHEFEALLFSDTIVWAEEKISDQLEKIKRPFSCPEKINDKTSPSRRLGGVFEKYGQKYKKINDGIIAAKKIGMTKMRSACPHFNKWITKLENLGNN